MSNPIPPSTSSVVPSGDRRADAFEEALRQALVLEDERSLDPRWEQALSTLREYALRPGKRVRPELLTIGYLASPRGNVPAPGLLQFAAGLELLHTFMLVHDDVADRAETRRGGEALHHALGRGRQGEDMAVVMGDHLFARAVELMMTADVPGAPQAARYMMQVCRHTAAGQYLDLQLATLPVGSVTLFQVMKVAHLKTAKYGFVAPLVCGALLGGGGPELREVLERVGRHAGVAFQLRDDQMGLFGDERVTGKSADGDYLEGKRTFPVVAAWARATAEERARLEELWAHPRKDRVAEARALVERVGGRSATERVIARATRSAQKSLAALPEGPARARLGQLLSKLQRRTA